MLRIFLIVVLTGAVGLGLVVLGFSRVNAGVSADAGFVALARQAEAGPGASGAEVAARLAERATFDGKAASLAALALVAGANPNKVTADGIEDAARSGLAVSPLEPRLWTARAVNRIRAGRRVEAAADLKIAYFSTNLAPGVSALRAWAAAYLWLEVEEAVRLEALQDIRALWADPVTRPSLLPLVALPDGSALTAAFEGNPEAALWVNSMRLALAQKVQ